MEEHRLRAFENRVLRWIPGHKQDKVTRELRNCTKNFLIRTHRQILADKLEDNAGNVIYGEKKNTWVQGFHAEPLGKETLWNTYAQM
jgi:hypothetical protein